MVFVSRNMPHQKREPEMAEIRRRVKRAATGARAGNHAVRDCPAFGAAFIFLVNPAVKILAIEKRNGCRFILRFGI